MRADGTPPRRLSLNGLAREFGRRFGFGTAQMYDHKAFTAVRDPREPGPGLYAVITGDLAEMREALLEDREQLDDTG